MVNFAHLGKVNESVSGEEASPGRSDRDVSGNEESDVSFGCKRGADVRPDFNWNRKPAPAIDFRNVTFLTDKARLKGQGRHVHSLPALANRALP
jgi:hypothetical protein